MDRYGIYKLIHGPLFSWRLSVFSKTILSNRQGKSTRTTILLSLARTSKTVRVAMCPVLVGDGKINPIIKGILEPNSDVRSLKKGRVQSSTSVSSNCSVSNSSVK